MSMRTRHQAWLQLVRAPNLLTAYGDPLAGACLMGACQGDGAVHRVILAAIASVAVYAAGMVDNDLVDRNEDGVDRPGRPIPSGAISLQQARKGRVLLFLVPYLIAAVYRMPLAWVLVHLLLLVNCLAYNRLKGWSPRMGVCLMGLCRMLSLLSGVVLGWVMHGMALWPLVVLLPWFAYVCGIALFAQNETSHVPGYRRYWLLLPPFLMVAGAALPGIPPLATMAIAAAGGFGIVLVLQAMMSLRAGDGPSRVPPLVGRLIRIVIPMQALLVFSAPGYGLVFSALLLLSWSVSGTLSRRFYAS
jgi:hypothetical protein